MTTVRRSSQRTPMRLDIRLLGPPEVLVDGRPLQVDTRKAVAILALLGAERRPFARDELAAFLWPDSDDVAARGALRRTLSTLRSSIGEGPLRIDRARVDLDPRFVRVDLAEVEAAARSDARSELAAAAGLARGAFLAGFNLRDSPEFDDWRASRAVAAERAVLTVLDRLASVAETAGDLPAAIDAAARRLDLDPLDEAGHVRLMDLYVAAGDRSGALRQYRACVAILERELGVSPLASTTARYEAIRDDVAPEPTPAATSAAVRALPLVGREADLAAIARALAAVRDGHGRIVALTGEAGIGKTRLGDEIVRRLRAGGSAALTATAHPAERGIAYGAIVELLRSAMSLPDAADRHARLDPATRAELARLLPALEERRLGAAPTEGPGAHARLVRAVADGLTEIVRGPVPGTLWIDDAQWLDDSSREALGFLCRRLAGRQLGVVLSWRPEDLDHDGQVFVDRLTGLAGTTVVVLDRLDRSAVATLVAAARPDAETGALADRLTTASEGLPLYVVEALAASDDAAPPSLPGTVGAVLRERLATVTETAGQVLAAASVIGRSFDLATVRHASGRSEEEAVDAVEESVRRGLIRETSAGFDFAHGALRDLAYDATSLSRRRLLHRRVAEALRLDLAGSGPDDLARLVLIATHERAAGREREAAEAYRLAGDRAAEVYANREAIAQYEAALALGHPDAVGLHAAIGRLRTRLGDYTEALEALEVAAASATPRELPGIEWALARVHLRRGDLAAAEHHLEAALDGAGDRLAAGVWVDRSVARRRGGDLAGAADAGHRALEVAGRSGDVVAAAAAHRLLGLTALDAGDLTTAVDELERARVAIDVDPDPTSAIAVEVALALARSAAGDTDDALVHGEVALQRCRRIGDRHLEAAVENHVADILHAAGREDEAMVHLRLAVEAFTEVGGDPADPDPGIWMLSAS